MTLNYTGRDLNSITWQLQSATCPCSGGECKSLVILQWLLSIRLFLGVQTVADLALRSYEKPITLSF